MFLVKQRNGDKVYTPREYDDYIQAFKYAMWRVKKLGGNTIVESKKMWERDSIQVGTVDIKIEKIYDEN